MEKLVNIHIEKLPEGLYLATSEGVQGLVAQGRTVTEALKIAKGVILKLLELQEENDIIVKSMSLPESFNYLLIIDNCIMEDDKFTENFQNLLASMSFEIRGEVNRVLGMSELLLRHSEKLSDKQIEYVNWIQKSGCQLLSIIYNMLESKYLSIKLDDETDKEVKKLTQETQVSRSWIIEEAIKRGLKELASDNKIQKT